VNSALDDRTAPADKSSSIIAAVSWIGAEAVLRTPCWRNVFFFFGLILLPLFVLHNIHSNGQSGVR
jgi:hypothetical protein